MVSLYPALSSLEPSSEPGAVVVQESKRDAALKWLETTAQKKEPDALTLTSYQELIPAVKAVREVIMQSLSNVPTSIAGPANVQAKPNNDHQMP